MNHKEELEKLHQQSLSKFKDYLGDESKIKKEDHEKVHNLKAEWEHAWNKLMETLLVLERLEI